MISHFSSHGFPQQVMLKNGSAPWICATLTALDGRICATFGKILAWHTAGEAQHNPPSCELHHNGAREWGVDNETRIVSMDQNRWCSHGTVPDSKICMLCRSTNVIQLPVGAFSWQRLHRNWSSAPCYVACRPGRFDKRRGNTGVWRAGRTSHPISIEAPTNDVITMPRSFTFQRPKSHSRTACERERGVGGNQQGPDPSICSGTNKPRQYALGSTGFRFLPEQPVAAGSVSAHPRSNTDQVRAL